MSGLLNETENTHSIHWFNGGWLDEKMKKANEESKKSYLELYDRAVKESASESGSVDISYDIETINVGDKKKCLHQNIIIEFHRPI